MASECEIFDRATVILGYRERTDYLQRACGRNEAVREHLEGHVEAHVNFGSLLESLPLAGPAPGSSSRWLKAPGVVPGRTCRAQPLESSAASGLREKPYGDLRKRGYRWSLENTVFAELLLSGYKLRSRMMCRASSGRCTRIVAAGMTPQARRLSALSSSSSPWGRTASSVISPLTAQRKQLRARISVCRYGRIRYSFISKRSVISAT